MSLRGQLHASLTGHGKPVTASSLDTDWEYRQQETATRLHRKIRRHAVEYERTLDRETVRRGEVADRLKDITDFDFRLRHRHLLSDQASPGPLITAPPRTSVRSAFWTCSRFSDCSQMRLRGPSITSDVISSPRCAGRQCIATAPGPAASSRASSTR